MVQNTKISKKILLPQTQTWGVFTHVYYMYCIWS